jgi:glycosyltransferase involved in cell wall biosynthesis
MSRPTICLSMIVRNEAHVVEEALASVAPHLDYWIVVDTGSTDGTQDVIRQFFSARSLPGELHERTWHDFGANRTEALALCDGNAEYAWVIDADDVVVGDLDLSNLRECLVLCVRD